jgi:hypothetical protein
LEVRVLPGSPSPLVSTHHAAAKLDLITSDNNSVAISLSGARKSSVSTQVDFVFDGSDIRGLEQNPDTKSRWAQLARSGKKVMQFLSESRYIANVVDGKVTLYGRRARTGG